MERKSAASSASEGDALASLVAQIADEFAAELDRGGRPDVERYAQRDPSNATLIRQVLSSLQLVRGTGAPGAATAEDHNAVGIGGGPRHGLADGFGATGTLGDFQLIREVGRGGMGVVYEAVQISLGRRVALKVLPFAAALDARHLQRFKNEAQAAAALQHPNIVPVYAVSCDRGVHCYAMQFIDGQTLGDAIAELRHMAPPQESGAPDASGGTTMIDPAQSACGLDSDGSDVIGERESGRAARRISHLVSTFSTRSSAGRTAFFNSVAEFAVQAAEALDYAHQMGITHRDVKPGNILIDVQGRLWIADFGLAQVRADSNLTVSGDILGTVRYMSPEQAFAKRGIVDHRSDIYSLGATFYELLTLRPMIDGRDREELLAKLAGDEPTPPGKVNRFVPSDLETIIMKAAAKSPFDRYNTARDLADDLKRFLGNQPIRARRPTVWDRGRKWMRRHRPLWASVAAALALVLVGSTLAAMQYAARQRSLAMEKAAFAHSREVARQKTATRLYRALFSEAAALQLAHRPGYRKQVWQRLHEAGTLGVEGSDAEELKRLVLSCLGDPIGLDPIAAPTSLPTTRPAVPQVLMARMTACQQGWQWSKYAATPDGQWAAAAFLSKVSLWSARDEAPVAWIASPLGQIYDMQFSPDKSLLICGCEAGVVILSTPGLQMQTYIREGNVYGISVHPKMKLIAAVGRRVELWAVNTNRLIASLPSPPAASSFGFSDDGQTLLASDAAGKVIHGWPVGDTAEKRILGGHDGGIPALAFSPDGALLASAGKDQMVRLWDARSGALVAQAAHPEGVVECLAFGPDNSVLATAGVAGIVRLWDAKSLRPLGQTESAAGPAQIWRLDFDPSGKFLGAAGQKGAVVWKVDLTSGEAALTPAGRSVIPNLFDMAIGPAGELALLEKEGRIYRHSLKTADESPTLTSIPSTVELGSLHWDATGRVLSFVTTNRARGWWDWKEQRLLGTSRPGISHPHASVSPNGRWLATAEQADRMMIYDLKRDRSEMVLPPETSEIWSFAWSPDGKCVAAGMSDGSLVVWNLAEVRGKLAEFDIPIAEDRPEAQ